IVLGLAYRQRILSVILHFADHSILSLVPLFSSLAAACPTSSLAHARYQLPLRNHHPLHHFPLSTCLFLRQCCPYHQPVGRPLYLRISVLFCAGRTSRTLCTTRACFHHSPPQVASRRYHCGHRCS